MLIKLARLSGLHRNITIFLASIVRPEVLDQATSHVKQLQGRIEELMNRRKEMQPTMKSSSARIPALNIRTRDTILEVNLITGLQKNFMLHEIINVLQEEGADIINFAYRSTCDSVYIQLGHRLSVLELAWRFRQLRRG
ncbi:hypothetical protein GH714_023129 [Hevea brasiliensis]|uniref:ACT domain-containing protein n=1 Tax=Hevea brasiliensis TaxID=3981 RepID=A0A6A6KCJ8_HEVBR|nr:hypothetical protein GH714_023129 [Hevea brasiliensis]